MPLSDTTTDDPRAFGLALGRFYFKDQGGGFWFYEGETLGFRAIFAYWPQYDLLITTAANSQAPNGEDRLGPTLVNGAFAVLSQAHLIDAPVSPTAKVIGRSRTPASAALSVRVLLDQS